MPINLNANSAQQLQELASMAYGHGSTTAGAGNIGMIGGHVVKFNTHLSERLFSSGMKADRQASCDALREHLGNLAKTLYGNNVSEGMTKILADLGINKDGTLLQGGKKLLDRKVVAKFVDQVKADGGAAQLADARGMDTVKDSSFVTIKAKALVANLPTTLSRDFNYTLDPIPASDQKTLQYLLRGPRDLGSQLFDGFDRVCYSVLTGAKTPDYARQWIDKRCKKVADGYFNRLFTTPPYVRLSDTEDPKKASSGIEPPVPRPLEMVVAQAKADMQAKLDELLAQSPEYLKQV